MEPAIPATVAEAIDMVVVNQTLSQHMAVQITMVFGYLVGLYLFLRQTRMAIRLFAHTIFLIALAYNWLGINGTYDVGDFLYQQMLDSIEAGVISGSGLSYFDYGEAPYKYARWVTFAVELFLVVTLTYLAFFFDWGEPEDAE